METGLAAHSRITVVPAINACLEGCKEDSGEEWERVDSGCNKKQTRYVFLSFLVRGVKITLNLG